MAQEGSEQLMPESRPANGSSPDAASQAASPPPAAAEAIAALSAASSSGGSGSGGRTEELLQQLIELQVRQAKETTTRQEASAKLERLQRRMENRTTRASAVAEALGVVCALLSGSMLSVLVYPPELEWDSEIWSGNFPAACYAVGGLDACRSWQHIYGTSASLAFVLVMVALLMTVEVFMGRTSWLHRALVVFFTGVQVSSITIVAAFWLSAPKSLAVFSVGCMSAFILLSMLLLPSVLTWSYYSFPVVGGRASMLRKLESEEYAGTLLESVRGMEDGVSSLHLVTMILLEGDSLSSRNSLFSRLTRFSFDSWLRLLVVAEEEIGRPAGETVPALLLVAFMGDARWAHIMLNSGAHPDCEFRDVGAVYFPLYVAARGGHSDVVDVLLRFDADPNKPERISGQTPLHAGAWGGSTRVVEALLRAGSEVGAVDNGGRAALHWAAERGHRQVVDQLLVAGAEVGGADGQGRTPLHLAAIAGQEKVIDPLLRAGADVHARASDGWTPLHAAAFGGDADVVASLLRAGSDVNALSDTNATPLHEAAARGHTQVVDTLLAAGAEPNVADFAASTPLHAAALAANLDCVRLLLRAGADPNRADNGWSPLHAAAVGGSRAVVEALLVAGSNSMGDGGWTPLLAAAWGGSLDVVEGLLGAGVDPRAVDRDGRTALHAAAWGGSDCVVAALLAAGADPRAADEQLHTPLHQAAAGGHLEVVQRLLAAGGDPTALDSDGRTALEDAEAGGHTQVAEALRKATEAWNSGAAAAAAVPVGTRPSAAVGCLGGRSEAGGPGARRLEQRAMLGGSCRAARLLAGAKAMKQGSFAMVAALGGRRGAARQAVAGAAVRRAHQQPMQLRPARQVLRSSALPLFAAL